MGVEGTRGGGGRKRRDGGGARGEEGCGRGPRHTVNSEGTTIKPAYVLSFSFNATMYHFSSPGNQSGPNPPGSGAGPSHLPSLCKG